MRLLRRVLGTWYGALAVLTIMSGSVTAALTFRSAIPFGTASSWSSATNDPNAVRGPWYNTNGHMFAHANSLDYQLDTIPYSVMAYGAVGNGTTDDTTAIQNAINAAPVGSFVLFPPGTYLVTSTITVARNYIHLVGAGTDATIIKFNPASAAVAIKFANGANTLYGNSIEDILFVSTGSNTQQKTAIQANDTSGLVISDVWIDPQNASTWVGSTSIGIQLKGREQTVVERVRIFADEPFQISSNPNSATYGCDHLHIEDVMFRPTPGGSQACVTIDDGVVVTNLSMDGFNSWIVDKYGLYWVETSSGAVSQNIAITNVRCEQAVDATGFCIYVDDTTGIQNFEVRDAQMATTPGQNGMHFKTVSNLTIANSIFGVNDATKTHLEIAGGVKDLFLVNNYVQVNTLTSLTGLTLLWAMPKTQSASTMPPTAWYADSTTASTVPEQLSGVMTVLGQTFKNTSSANTNPTVFDTTNTFSGGNCMFDWLTGGSLKACVDSGGSFLSGSGIFDANAAVQAKICNTNSSSCVVGTQAKGLTLSGLIQTGLPAKANNTIASATTIAPTAYVTHITGTNTLQTLTAPTPFAQTNGGGCLILVFDGIAPWNAAGNIFVAGTPTTAGTSVEFCYDNATTKWYPSRTL